MKIHSTPFSAPTSPLDRVTERGTRDVARAPVPDRAPIEDRADLSSTGRVVADLREAARAEGPYGGVRDDVVASIKREIAEGRFGGPQDVERAIDALMMEL